MRSVIERSSGFVGFAAALDSKSSAKSRSSRTCSKRPFVKPVKNCLMLDAIEEADQKKCRPGVACSNLDACSTECGRGSHNECILRWKQTSSVDEEGMSCP